jgi:ABC-type transporter Mla subunit MlaD
LKTQFSVGLLVLAAFGLIIGFTLFLTGDRLRNRGEVFETYIRESVQGLEVGAPVRFRGVAVGRVTEIALASSRYRRPEGVPFAGAFQLVLVRFTVQMQLVGEVPSVTEAVDIGLRARLSSQGLTGVGYIELDFIDPERFPMQRVPWTPEAIFVPSIPSTTAQVQDSAQMLLQRLENVDIQGIVSNLSNLLADARGQLGEGGDVRILLSDASQVMRSLRGAVDQADLPALAVELRRTVTTAQNLLNSRELQQAISQGSAAMGELRTAAARLPASIAQLEGGLRTARGATLDVQADLVPILRDLRAMTANLRDVTEALRRSPSQTLLGGPPPAGAPR